MNEEALLSETVESVARLTLNRPKAMNAMNMALLAELGRKLKEITADDAIRAVVITGSGAAFCAGADLKEVLTSQKVAPGEADFLDLAESIFNCLRNFPKPVIAALNGVTMAGGLELAMCADIVVAAESATIGDAHANFGVYPGAGGAAVLPRLVPLNVAMYLLMTGKSLSAAEMKTYGFIAEVHPDAALGEAAMKLAGQIAKKSPIVLRRMKEVARASADKSRDEALLHEQVMLRRHLRSFDLQEGLQAFAEKRAPQFQGR
ncbi:MAG: enoyl-CoA hydratase/isomerase family protein [Burkholderiaceae bacterium]|nr:enoyl-CoA hydratase/isomerase family protein [Burkholderiaceae bacterium]